MTRIDQGALLALAMAASVMSGCSKPVQKAAMMDLKTFDVAANAPPVEPGTGSEGEAHIPIGAPQIAYSYDVQYVFEVRNVAEVQSEQIAVCRRLAPRCVVQKSNMTAAGPRDTIVTNTASMLIDARLAAAFNRRLDAIAERAGAKVFNRQTTAEDVTKQAIDTDARIRAKQALADRLLKIIQTSNGKVGELVEAERAYATAQEELDAARGQQAELRQRVQMSAVGITYMLNTADTAWEPIRRSSLALGETLASSIAGLITFVVALMPWALLLALCLWLRRRFGWRWPLRRSPPPV